MFKVSEFVSLANRIFVDKGLPELSSQLNSQGKGQFPAYHRDGKHDWLNNGIVCEILKPGRNWQKGKVRIKVTLEFCPDEPEVEETLESNNSEIQHPESPLDDIRKMMN